MSSPISKQIIIYFTLSARWTELAVGPRILPDYEAQAPFKILFNFDYISVDILIEHKWCSMSR